MILRAYVDESGTHNSAEHLLFAGVISSRLKWKSFDRAWNRALKEFGVSQFHATDYQKNRGQFNWPARNDKLFGDQLLAASEKGINFGLTVRIDYKDYDEVYRADPLPKKQQLDSIYGLGFRVWLHRATEYITDLYRVGAQPVERLDVVLEQGHKNAGGARAAFIQLRKSGALEVPLGRFSFGDKSMPGIGAADLIAHSSWNREHSPDSFKQVQRETTLSELKKSSLEPVQVFRDHADRELLVRVKGEILERDAQRLSYHKS